METTDETITVETSAEILRHMSQRTSEWRQRHAGHDVVPADTAGLREDGQDIFRLLFCLDCRAELRFGLRRK